MGPAAHFLFVLSFVSQDWTGLPIDTSRIAEIIEPSLDAMGYRVVRVAVLGAGRMTLQIMAKRRDEATCNSGPGFYGDLLAENGAKAQFKAVECARDP